MRFHLAWAGLVLTSTTIATAQDNPKKTTTSSKVVVTTTTGTPPASVAVTYSAAKNTAFATLKSVTTVSGSTLYPSGLYWVAIAAAAVAGGAAVALPKPPPAVPPEFVPSEPTAPPDATQGCQSTTTPTVTVVISYSRIASGSFTTRSGTMQAYKTGTCNAPEVTTTSVQAWEPQLIDGGDFDKPSHVGINGQVPLKYNPVDKGTVQKLLGFFKNSKLNTDSIHPVRCTDIKYLTNQKTIPNAARFISGTASTFCADWKADLKKAYSRTYTARDVKSKKSRRRLLGRTPPPDDLTPDSYPYWSIDYSWKADSDSGTCKTEDFCNQQLKLMLTSCEGANRADAYGAGNITNPCGVFSYTLHLPPPPKPKGQPYCKVQTWDDCEQYIVDPPSSGFIGGWVNGKWSNAIWSWPRQVFEAAAYDYCNSNRKYLYDHSKDSKHLDSTDWYYMSNDTKTEDSAGRKAVCLNTRVDIHMPTGFISKDPYQSKCKGGSGLLGADSNLLLSVKPSPNQSGCKPFGDNIYEIPKGPDCVANFQAAIDGCKNPLEKDGSESFRYGVYKDSTERGCWDYWLIGTHLVNDQNFKRDSDI